MAQSSPSFHIDNFQVMSSPNRSSLQALTSLYQKTTQAFLLRNYDSAYSLCMSAISKLADFPPVTVSPSTKIIQIKIWCLYINLVAALLAEKHPIATENHEIKRLLERPPEKICNEVYTRIVTTGYNNEDGEIPGEIIIACILLCINQNCPKLACQIIEDWYYSLPKSTIIRLDRDDPVLKCYEKVVKLHVLHVLPKLKEWEKANSFLANDEILDEEHKKAYEQSLAKLKEKSNKSLSSKKSKLKREKSKRDEVNGYVNEFSHHRLDYSHTNGLRPSINHHKLLNGLQGGNHRQLNSRSFMGNPRSLSIAGNSRNNVENPPSTTVTDTRISNIQRFLEAFLVSLQRMASKVSVPKFLLVIVLVVLASNWNKIKREFVLKGVAKFWETVKAGTTIP